MRSISGSHLNLGVILCKHCGEMIDTVDTDRVIVYYSQCEQELCKQSACMKQLNETNHTTKMKTA
ncbi:hypothetical protein ACFQ88_12420 [Paenibacillus sp. NPDC056579]|uniref:hypothetical protein n=1 Tax=Paenibacillus sp. NPDC056579 TaxID=3345871 RepID=UPI0036A9BA1E